MKIINVVFSLLLISCTQIHGATNGKQVHNEKAAAKELKVEIDLTNHMKHEFAVKKTITLPYNPLAAQAVTLTKVLVPNSDLTILLQIIARNFGDSYTVALLSYVKSKDKKDEFDPLATHYLNLALCQEGEVAMTGQYRFKAKAAFAGIPCKENGQTQKTATH